MKLPLIFLTLFLFNPLEAAALRQFRCGDRVQYRPCEMKLFEDFRGVGLGESTAKRDRHSSKTPRSGIAGPLFAEVTDSSFQSLPDGDGKWSGKVRGNGEVALTLQFLRDGKIDTERPMGGTLLIDDETTFSFITALPREKGWSWNIVASAS